MRRRIFAVLFILLTSVSFLFGEDEEWYWNKPITRVEFNGLKNVSKSDLNSISTTFINEPFNESTYNEILDRLYSLDYFEDITPYAKHDSKNEGGVLLVFDVVENPVIKSISFTGNKKVRNGELREQIKTKSSDVYVESKVLIDERIIRNYLLQKGYTSSTVSHEVKETADGMEIIFIIKEGANTVISEILFTGNTIASSRTLKRKMQLKEVGFMKDGAYQPSTLEQDKLNIIAYYKDHGYADASISDVKITSSLNEEKQRNELTVNFIIHEGVQYTYAGLRISGNEVFTEEELLNSKQSNANNGLNEKKKLRVGSIYSETKFQEYLRQITNVYYENGYMTNEFYPVPVKDSDRREISYDLTIREHGRSHIENVIIKGNTKTKDYVIRREIPIEPGDIFSKDKIENGLRNLMNLRYFSNVVPEPQMGTEQNLVDLVVNVEEQSTANFNFGFNFAGTSDPGVIPISLFFKIENTNMFGEGKTISAETKVSNTEQSIGFGYSQNWIGDLPLAISTDLSLSHAKLSAQYNYFSPTMDLYQNYYYMNYQNWDATLSTAVSRRWTPDYAILTVAGGISNVIARNVYDESIFIPVDEGVGKNANRWGITNSIFASFSVDNRDISYDPSRGWFGSQRLSWYGLIPKVENEFFLKSDTKLEGYFKLFDFQITDNYSLKMVFAAYTGLTCIIPVNSNVSSSNKLYIDGLINGRGWQNMYNQVKGMAMFSNKIELRVPVVPGIIGINAFWDAVAIKDKSSDLSNLSLNDFYFSYGPTIKLLMPQLPLNLVFAWKYRIIDGKHVFDDNPFQFVLSFNIVNH